MSKILVLGATGMLGSAVMAHASELGLDVAGTTTQREVADRSPDELIYFDAATTPVAEVVGSLAEQDLVINCVGLIKHLIDDASLYSRERAIALNANLPHQLDRASRERGFRIIQIATDCVYDGRLGSYVEESSHNEGDVYGQTKSLGEVPSPQIMHIRASIIGRELREHRSLVDWAVLQPKEAVIRGYTDHFWNGVTTTAFARVALGVVRNGIWRPGLAHLVPADSVSKYELLGLILRTFGRDDIEVVPTETGSPVNRTLASSDPARNEALWAAGGYTVLPTIADMVKDLERVQGEDQ
ncbi:dTDP-4-dehydrorhamnose reductase [Microbacterium sp. W4I4]|uniref:sugar nucleotide-binding protein n=1 Tax=Microbacterium sp. W4I4 TaxID=3042295 RepID=UPI0027859893|nr:sugar nucleotide-binding protein [Microbacterium sp. W4I4]MDQ0613795.1 dTDP-4-dehydrorhamnose reductase [Microbacterium sp. W4I4]